MASAKEGLEKICEDVVREVSGALGCAVVDLNSGLLLGAYYDVPYFTQTYVEAVGAAAVDMMRGRGVSNVEELLSTQRGEEIKNTIQEVQMTTTHTYHFMSSVPGKIDALAVLITDKKANMGAGWAAIRGAMKKMAPFCP